MRPPTAALLLTLTLLLTGCGMGPRLIPSPAPGTAIHGNIHGGQQPVAGARVYLLAAGTSAFAGPSSSVLSHVVRRQSDDIGNYILTAADGSFDITGDYTCTPGQQLYLLARGGDSGGGPNSAIGLMALLGDCSSVASIPFVEINEVSTAAAAFAIAPFAADDIDIANDEAAAGNTTSTPAHTGLVNAFANVSNLVDLGSGVALATTPGGNGTAPQATLNTLANILAACVNTADPLQPSLHTHSARPHDFTYSGTCTQLFSATSQDGFPVPTDTASAAINLARSPASNLDTLWSLPATKPPFSPALTSEPTDFTLTLAFTATHLHDYAMAFDASGDLWYTYGPGIAELTPLGTEAAGSPFADSSIIFPLSLAIDISNNVWVPDYIGNTLTEFSSSGAFLQTGTIPGVEEPYSIAIDPSGNLWLATASGGTVTKTTSSGTLIASYTGNGKIASTTQAVSDAAGLIWLPNPGKGYFVLLNNDGTPATASPIYPVDGVTPTSGQNLGAIDASNRYWTFTANGTSIGAIDANGQPLSGDPFPLGTTPSGAILSDSGLIIDGAGTVWAAVNYSIRNNSRTGPAQPFSHFGPLSPSRSAAGAVNETAAQTSAHPDVSFTNFSSIYGYTSNSLFNLHIPVAPNALAIDPSGDLWYADGSTGFYEVLGIGAPVVLPIAAAVAANKIATLP